MIKKGKHMYNKGKKANSVRMFFYLEYTKLMDFVQIKFKNGTRHEKR